MAGNNWALLCSQLDMDMFHTFCHAASKAITHLRKTSSSLSIILPPSNEHKIANVCPFVHVCPKYFDCAFANPIKLKYNLAREDHLHLVWGVASKLRKALPHIWGRHVEQNLTFVVLITAEHEICWPKRNVSPFYCVCNCCNVLICSLSSSMPRVNSWQVSLVEAKLFSGTTRCAEKGLMYSFCGQAAVGHRANSFKSLDNATPLWVIQVLPMEVTI